ncbi:MAG: branched-chain amino acid ABC transporter permease [Streptosporangiaceae bacterium]
MDTFFLGVGFGLVTASVLAISAVALTLQFSVTDVPNFSHGELMTIGAYTALEVQSFTSNLVVGALLAAVSGSVLALILNLLLRRFIRAGAKRFVLFVITIAYGLLLQNVYQLVWGVDTRAYTLPLSEVHHIGPMILTGRQLAIIAIAVLAMIAVHVMLRYTKFGKAQRAVADNKELARVTGISVGRVVTITWLITGAMAGLAGFILGMTVGAITPTLGFNFLLTVFAAVIIGGLGKPYGAMAGALIIGLVTEVSALYIDPDYTSVLAFAILLLALAFRPQGLVATFREVQA